jgi:spore coat polysaccharide biosynthesis protein SpsF (cytidylyltransferase family)
MVGRIAWLLFIRAASTRLPGKCYVPIRGRNILQILSDESKANEIACHDLILCTSIDKANDKLCKQALALGHPVLFGDEDRPLTRILLNWKHLERYDYLVRICGDSPFYPFDFARRAISHYSNQMPDAITNTRLRNFPSGYSIEVYARESLRHFLEANQQYQNIEHMSQLLLESPFMKDRLIVDINVRQNLGFFRHNRYTVDFGSDVLLIQKYIDVGLHEMYTEQLRRLDFQ